MNFIEIKNKDEYNGYVAGLGHSQFLQSWEWGEFQASAGHPVFRFGLREDGRLILAATLIQNGLPRGKSYLYLPRVGIKDLTSEQLGFFLDNLAKFARSKGVIFLRFEPRSDFDITKLQRFSPEKTLDVQPIKTLILDLSGTEEEILATMHQKTRYNIRLAEKKGIEIGELHDDEFEEFWKLMMITSERDGFRLHDKEYYKKMISMNCKLQIANCKLMIDDQKLENNLPTGNQTLEIQNSKLKIEESIGDQKLKIKNLKLKISVLVARHEGKILAANIVSFFGNTSTYVHGASSNECRNLMPTFLLQWRSMQEAKKFGCRFYDFHGIDETKWPGVTRFKLGFGGEEINYPGAFDFVLSKSWYIFYKALRYLRRKLG